MFFTVRLSRNGRYLTYGMRPFLRGTLLFALASVLAMILFSLTAEDLAGMGAAGRVNLVLMPLLLALGSLYQYRLRFDSEGQEVFLDQGLLFLYRRKRWSFDDVTGMLIREYPTRKLDLAGSRCQFGFYLSGKPVILERSLSPGNFQAFYYAFASFFPRSIPGQESRFSDTMHP